MSPDKPVPVVNPLYKNENPGMAKNVQRNILSKIKDCDLITNLNWQDICKTRYIHDISNHMFLRVDNCEKIERIDLSKIDYNYDYIVISDYNKGFLTEEDIETISKNHNCIFLDTKKILGSWAKNIKFIKINNVEFERSKKYIDSHMAEKIIKTCGANGCFYKNISYPVDKVNVIDVSGAGDSFLAALVIEYSKSQDIIKSIKYANKCASKIVKEKGVTCIT
jgi:D-beta-D-heptose 7-phosphate kinase/D-beta-D-heptose 1-phosphate adenosyltransferase